MESVIFSRIKLTFSCKGILKRQERGLLCCYVFIRQRTVCSSCSEIDKTRKKKNIQSSEDPLFLPF